MVHSAVVIFAFYDSPSNEPCIITAIIYTSTIFTHAQAFKRELFKSTSSSHLHPTVAFFNEKSNWIITGVGPDVKAWSETLESLWDINLIPYIIGIHTKRSVNYDALTRKEHAITCMQQVSSSMVIFVGTRSGVLVRVDVRNRSSVTVSATRLKKFNYLEPPLIEEEEVHASFIPSSSKPIPLQSASAVHSSNQMPTSPMFSSSSLLNAMHKSEGSRQTRASESDKRQSMIHGHLRRSVSGLRSPGRRSHPRLSRSRSPSPSPSPPLPSPPPSAAAAALAVPGNSKRKSRRNSGSNGMKLNVKTKGKKDRNSAGGENKDGSRNLSVAPSDRKSARSSRDKNGMKKLFGGGNSDEKYETDDIFNASGDDTDDGSAPINHPHRSKKPASKPPPAGSGYTSLVRGTFIMKQDGVQSDIDDELDLGSRSRRSLTPRRPGVAHAIMSTPWNVCPSIVDTHTAATITCMDLVSTQKETLVLLGCNDGAAYVFRAFSRDSELVLSVDPQNKGFDFVFDEITQISAVTDNEGQLDSFFTFDVKGKIRRWDYLNQSLYGITHTDGYAAAHSMQFWREDVTRQIKEGAKLEDTHFDHDEDGCSVLLLGDTGFSLWRTEYSIDVEALPKDQEHVILGHVDDKDAPLMRIITPPPDATRGSNGEDHKENGDNDRMKSGTHDNKGEIGTTPTDGVNNNKKSQKEGLDSIGSGGQDTAGSTAASSGDKDSSISLMSPRGKSMQGSTTAVMVSRRGSIMLSRRGSAIYGASTDVGPSLTEKAMALHDDTIKAKLRNIKSQDLMKNALSLDSGKSKGSGGSRANVRSAGRGGKRGKRGGSSDNNDIGGRRRSSVLLSPATARRLLSYKPV